MQTDLYNNIKVTRVLDPTVVTNADTPQVGEIVDNSGFDSLTYVILTGDLTDANATFTTLLEEGDESDLGDNSNVADGDMIGTEAAASFDYEDDNSQFKLAYKGSKRYTRLTITPSGNNSGSAYLAVVAIQGGAKKAPQS